MNKLLDEYNNTYHCSSGKKLIDADYSGLTKKIESSHKASKFKFGDRAMITKYKNIFSKGCIKDWSKETFEIESVLKIDPWMYKLKDVNGETLTGSFYEKEFLLRKL